MIKFGLIFMTGLLSSLHCVGMCGPIILASQAPNEKTGGIMTYKSMLMHNALYNTTRIISYTILGALFGYLGMQLGFIRVISEYISIIGGVFLIIAGLLLLDIFPGIRIFPVSWSLNISKLLGKFFKKSSPGLRILFGMLTPLLPCGILYAMFIQAATEESAINGALTLAVFGLGTLPSLLLLGSFSSFFSLKIRKRANMVAGVLIVLLGTLLILRGYGNIPYMTWIMGEQNSGRCH
jgi:sulfite exporter TauE/SafE